MPIINRFGRPGLLGMAARTAVVAGTATAVSGRVAQRQRDRALEHQALAQAKTGLQTAAQYPAPPASVPPPVPVAPSASASPTPTGTAPDLTTRLLQLGEMHQQGLLSAEEFASAKRQLLNG